MKLSNPRHLPHVVVKTLALTGFATLSSLSALPVQAITVINTASAWNESSTVTAFGGNGIGTATFGQTVTTPADSVLNYFSFILGPSLAGNPITFQGYVAQWDGEKATGPMLYSSGEQTYSGGGFETYTFNTGSLALTPNQQYVLFINASSNFATSGQTGQAIIFNDVYSGGNFVFSNNDDNFELLTTNAWDSRLSDTDLAFTASFVAVPIETDALPVLGSTIFFGLGRAC